MALETREEFLEEWVKVAESLFGPEGDEAKTLKVGSEMYDARVLAYNVAEEGLNLTVHRYFHGMATVGLTFMMQLPLEGMLPFLVGEAMFHEGFIAGMNYERNGEGDGTGLGNAEEAQECLGPRANIVHTREELEKTRMPIPIQAIIEFQKVMKDLADGKGNAGEVEGSPVILPEDEERGYA